MPAVMPNMAASIVVFQNGMRMMNPINAPSGSDSPARREYSSAFQRLPVA